MNLPTLLSLLVIGADERASLPVEEELRATLFTDVAVLDPEADELARGRDVLVEGGRVAAIAPTGELSAPPGARVVDGAGRVLAPGLIDACARMQDEGELVLHLAHGVTAVRVLDGAPGLVELRDALRRGERAGPELVVGGPELRGTLDRAARRREVLVQEKLGYELLTLAAPMELGAHDELVALARERGLAVGGPRPDGVALDAWLRGPLACLDRVESLFDMERGVPVSPGDQELARRIELVRDAGLPVTTALAAFAALIPQIEHRAELLLLPEIGWVDPPSRQIWDDHGHGMRRHFTSWAVEPLTAALAEQMQLARRLVEAGVPLAVGTESMTAFVVPGLAMHAELDRLTELGLAPAEVLRAATVNGARVLGREDLGRVRVGAAADLVLLEDDPREDLALLERPAGVMARGRWFARAQLDRALEELRQLYADELRFVGVLGTDGLEAALSARAEILRADPGAHVLREATAERVGQLLIVARRRSDAERYAAFCVETWPDALWAHLLQGEAHLDAKRMGEARECAKRALELAPGDLRALSLSARCFPARAPAVGARELRRPAPAGPTDWARFRGPNGAGRLQSGALPATLDPERDLAWRTVLPDGFSSPVLDDERVYVTGYEGRVLWTLCLDRLTGRLLWKQEAPARLARPPRRQEAPASPTPVCDGAGVVALFDGYGLVAYDVEGAERWRVPLGPFATPYGLASSPIVADGLVLALCDHDEGSFLLAVDAQTGAERWRRPRPRIGHGTTTPIVHALEGGGSELIVAGTFRFVSYGLADGAPRWWLDGTAWGMTAPVLHEDVLVAHSWLLSPSEMRMRTPAEDFAQLLDAHDADGDGGLSRDELAEVGLGPPWLRYDADQDGRLDASEWEWATRNPGARTALLALRLGGEGDVGATRTLWSEKRDIPDFASPLVYGGLLYVLRDGGVLSVLEPETGELVTRLRLEGALDSVHASPVAGDGRIYTASTSGLLTVIAPGREPEVLSTSNLGEEVLATPALAPGAVYVRSRAALYCFAGGGE